MKRFLVVSVKEGEDSKTKEKLLFVSMYRMPSKMKNGGLWYPKQTEAVSVACYNLARNPEEFEKYRLLSPGALVDVTFGVNDFNGKTFVANVSVVEQSPFTDNDLYI